MNVLTIGSALVDIFIHSHSFMMSDDNQGLFSVRAVGGKLAVENLFIRTGGGASNTAVGFKRLGFDVALIAEVGKDELAQTVMNDLTREQVNTEYMVEERKEQTGGSVILVCDDGQRTALVHRGAAAELNPHDLPLAQIELADWIHASSIAGQLETLLHLAAEVKKHRVGLSFNPGAQEIELAVAGKYKLSELRIEQLFVNEQEWQALTTLHEELLASIPEIIVTSGSKGGWVYTKNQDHFAFPAQKVRAVDATGAGDAFVSGYVSARLNDQTPQVAARWGALNAAAVVQQVGAKPGLLVKKNLRK